MNLQLRNSFGKIFKVVVVHLESRYTIWSLSKKKLNFGLQESRSKMVTPNKLSQKSTPFAAATSSLRLPPPQRLLLPQPPPHDLFLLLYHLICACHVPRI